MQLLTSTRGANQSSHRLLTVFMVAGAVLLFTVATAVGDWTTTTTETTTDIEITTNETNTESSQSVTMKIDLEENDVIDLELARGDVVVDTWEGDDVLVIVEKNAGVSSDERERSLNIKVTRHGNNVHIATLDQSGRPFTDANLSLRIMVPKRAHTVGNVNTAYDLSKLTSLIFKALHREAMNWIIH